MKIQRNLSIEQSIKMKKEKRKKEKKEFEEQLAAMQQKTLSLKKEYKQKTCKKNKPTSD